MTTGIELTRRPVISPVAFSCPVMTQRTLVTWTCCDARPFPAVW
jgi:hypothetical protein